MNTTIEDSCADDVALPAIDDGLTLQQQIATDGTAIAKAIEDSLGR